MLLINRSDRGVLWRAFNADDALTDPSNLLHFTRAPRKAAMVQKDQEIGVDWGTQNVQLEITDGVVALGPAPNVLVYGSRASMFHNDRNVVFTGSGLVELDDEIIAVMKLASFVHATPGEVRTDAIDISFGELMEVTTAIVGGLVTAYAQPSVVLGSGTIAIGLASAILGVASADADPPSLDLATIAAPLRNVIDDAKANELRAHILATSQWFDGWVRKSKALAGAGHGSQASVDLGAADRRTFLSELDDHVDGRTSFKHALDELAYNRPWRLRAIPEYILGVGLMLHFRRIELLVAQEQTKLTKADIERVVSVIEFYRRTLSESEDDFKEMRYQFLNQRRLIPPEWASMYDQNNIWPMAITDKGEMNPVEGKNAALGLTAKYLKGDRWLITKTITNLNQVIKELNEINVS